ncbi:MAG TPA: ABC transporter permease [Solirubrobacteraceae bacterium]|jgi:ribose transport system permease protein|nr:ABC transporter permease [Solirubrobacteraceae bacterium]
MSTTTSVQIQEAEQAVAVSNTPLARLRRLLVDTPEIGIVVAVIASFAIFTSINSDFSSGAELQNLGVDLSGFAILAIGESFCIITGGIDLGVGSLTALFAVVAAWMNVSLHIPVFLTFLLVIVCGALWGLGHGLLITRLGVAPFVVTLFTFIFAAGADEALAPNPIPVTSSVFLSIVGSTVAGVPIAVIVLLVIAIGAWFVLERTYIGRQIYAVGGNAEAARLAGIPVRRRITVVYMISGACAGVVGIIVASHLTSGTADSVSGWELIAIASCVIGGVSLIGGQGRMIGVVAGAALLVVLRDGLVAVNVNTYYQSMVVGAVLLFAIVVDRLRVIRLERSGKRVRRVAEVKAASHVPPEDVN